MKKVIGIYCGDFTYGKGGHWDSNVIETEGAGGSETWAVGLATAFQSKGFHCIVFGNPEVWHFDKYGVEYVPYQFFESRCEYQHFDYFISSRRTDEITDNINCDNIYIMSHEIGVFNRYWGQFCSYDELRMDKVKKIGVLSEWHANATKKMYPQLTDDRLFITHNAIDTRRYENVDDSAKRNMMVWSTCLNRGLTFFGQRVFPKVKKAIPDFELNICSYNTDIHGIIPEDENIHFLGTLTKEELSSLQKEAKVWALPNYGINDFGEPLHESFCITAVENAMAGNAIVCFDKDGLTTTLDGYSGILKISHWFDEYGDVKEDDIERLSIIMSNEIISLLRDNNKRNARVMELKDICSKYTWENSADTWLKEWGLIEKPKMRVVYIVTNGYVGFFKKFYETLPYFFPDIDKDVTILTNNTEFFDDYKPYRSIKNIEVIKMFDLLYPCINLHKTYFLEQLEKQDEYDYVFYFDSDTIFKECGKELWKQLKCTLDNNNVIISKHPIYAAKEEFSLFDCRRNDWISNFHTSNLTERDETRQAYIPDVEYDYVISSFFGSNKNTMKRLCNKVNNMCRVDLTRSTKYHIPQYMDENYFNALVYRFYNSIDTEISFDVSQYSELYNADNDVYDTVFMYQKNMKDGEKTNRR